MNSLSKATLVLDDETGSFQLLDHAGLSRVDALSILLRPERVAAFVEKERDHVPQVEEAVVTVLEQPSDSEPLPEAAVESECQVDAEPEADATEHTEALIEPSESSCEQPSEPTTQPAPEAEHLASPQGTVLDIDSQAHGTFRIVLPFVLSEKQTKIFTHIARYGHATREDLTKVVSKRSGTTASKLVDRLHEAGVPYIRITEGQTYEFNYSS